MTHLLQLIEPEHTNLVDAREDMNRWVGIDFGTTHSLIGHYCEVKNPEQSVRQMIFFKDQHGRHILPSVVNYTHRGEMVSIGQWDEGEASVRIASIKRFLSRGKRIVRGAGNDITEATLSPISVGEAQISPIHIAAEIINALKLMAEDQTGEEITNAVITVPAYYDEIARAATRLAAQHAGFVNISLLSEPTAAALAFGLSTTEEGLYGVYDLGGGTFDFSLLRCEQGFFRVLATVGDTQLGGDDCDEALATLLIEKGALYADRSEAIRDARRVKHILSQDTQARIDVAGTVLTVTRVACENLMHPLIARTVTLCAHALNDADVTWGDLSGILLVGGSTRIPLVRRMLEEQPITCLVRDDLHPDESVAQGAAIRAHQIMHGSAHTLADVTPLSLGVETMGGVVERIITRNSPIPVAQSHEFTTFQDEQQGISLHIVQGEREMAKDCRSLGRFSLTGIPPMPAGRARIQVTFTLDADGLLSVDAYEKSTGIRQGVQLNPIFGLCEPDIADMVIESLDQASTDMDARLLIGARQKAERLLRQVTSFLDVCGADAHADLRAHVANLRLIITSSDRNAIHEAIAAVEVSLKSVAEAHISSWLSA
ncbi:MAG: Hsp70 family protein [Alphaproteobacteria bacterium]|nr:MAG: Hsp70 family protein [Alphaproteobacteria bacterium]